MRTIQARRIPRVFGDAWDGGLGKDSRSGYWTHTKNLVILLSFLGPWPSVRIGSDRSQSVMIIFGTRGVTWNGESGEFVCPGCGGTTQQYTRKTIRRFFTLYFIPLIPLDKLGEYIECQHCRNTYNEQVLSYN